MDELIIGDKKYISSKRAAEITGYAKDYIGQLCREGKVEARLVGRSWYVLDAAIQDHRFGKPEDLNEPKAEKSTQNETFYTYKAEEFRPIPEVGRKEITQEPLIEDEPKLRAKPISLDSTQEAWRDWFTPPASPEEEITIEQETQFEQNEAEEVSVPMFDIREPVIENVALESKTSRTSDLKNISLSHQIKKSRSYTGLRIFLLSCSVIAVLLVILASGKVDVRVLKAIGPVGALSGLSWYTVAK